MRGCLKFILAIIMVCLLAVVGAGIYGLFWANQHLYSAQPLETAYPNLDPAVKARLLKLFPLRSFFSGQSKKSSVDLDLSRAEADFVANHVLSEKKPDAHVSLGFGDDRLSIKYCQKITPKKYVNLMLDTGLIAEKGNFRVNLERLQVGDFLTPVTLLGQLNYLVELYLSRGFGVSGDGTVKISDLKLKDDHIKLVFVKS
jgi:hypothetical protein